MGWDHSNHWKITTGKGSLQKVRFRVRITERLQGSPRSEWQRGGACAQGKWLVDSRKAGPNSSVGIWPIGPERANLTAEPLSSTSFNARELSGFT